MARISTGLKMGRVVYRKECPACHSWFFSPDDVEVPCGRCMLATKKWVEVKAEPENPFSVRIRELFFTGRLKDVPADVSDKRLSFL